jgi:hypothetical protein
VPETVAVEEEAEEVASENVPEDVAEPEAEIPKATFEAPEVAVELPQLPIEIPLEIESITQRSPAATDGNITPIDMIENIKLETFVNKTIVNDNNVVDVPVFDEKDKMLEEVRKMISEPQTDATTVTFATTTESTTVHHVPETTEAPTTIEESEQTTVASTIPVLVITTTQAPEAETIFVPIMTNNNENINVYEEKFPVVETTTEGSLRVSFLLVRSSM